MDFYVFFCAEGSIYIFMGGVFISGFLGDDFSVFFCAEGSFLTSNLSITRHSERSRGISTTNLCILESLSANRYLRFSYEFISVLSIVRL